ncbi:hypothetical protein [Fulvivirga ligni]|uniref:hypothetical protein n=1 Tax=Fulvivirga ligni TaxID=2904246 RepID=UPI001F3B354E|nr:hypothetical protein [Fulvivirga ligni]UII20665.1 hypothetical protein LVD16_22755 [Fulvivirga ligni]
MSKNKLLLSLPPFIAALFDTSITIAGQTQKYWDGDLSQANEGNPIGATFMSWHVSGLFIISGIWLIIIPLAGYYLPKKASKIFLLFVLIAHSFGGSTWLVYKYHFWLAMLFILFNATFYVLINERHA